MQIADINELVAVLKIQKSNNLGAMIFLGAGASVTGNVPLADQLAQALLENDLYKPLLSNTPNKEYGTLMGCLTPAMRKAFLKPYMENAQINETHLYASFLVESGYIDTVLTVNFDPLTYLPFQYTKTRPNIYDVTGHSGIVLGGIEYPAIVFLHGQHHGFWQMNTNQEMHATLRNTKEVLTSLLSTRTLIIIGYSGRDPIFQVLQEIPKFEHNLYWIGYNEFPPPIHIKDNLLNEEHRSVKFLPGFDSDSFFRTLCKELGVQLPSIFSNPQKFLLEKAKLLADHKNVESGQSLKEELLKSINKLQGDYYQFKFQVIASPNFVTPEIQKLIQSLEQIIKQEEFSKAEELASEVLKSKNSMVFGLMSEALTGFGDNLIQLGKASNNKDLVQVGIDKLHLAITYYPISELIWCKIGDGLILLSSLVNWDLTKVDKAIQKFDNALKINTKSAYPRFRKGVCYVIKAKITGNNIELWEKALQQFKIYNRSSDKMSDHLTQIADLYAEYAKLSNSGENYEKAFGYYKQSFSMEEGNLDNLLNWANALIQYSKFKVNSSTELYMAIDKLSVIQKTNSDLYRLHILFGLAYSLLAKNSGSKTKENYGKSYEHYQRAIKIEPGNYISYFNWGVSLYEKALQENSNLKLLHEAKSRFEKANEIHEYDEGYFYLGLIYWNIYNKTKKSADQKKYINYYERVLDLNPKHYKALNNLAAAHISLISENVDVEYNICKGEFLLGEMSKINPNDKSVLLNSGSLLLSKGDLLNEGRIFKKALDSYFRAFTQNGIESTYYYYVAEGLINWLKSENGNVSDDWKNYVDKYEQFIKRHKSFSELMRVWVTHLTQYILVNKVPNQWLFNRQIKQYEKLIRLDPENEVFYCNIGSVYAMKSDYDANQEEAIRSAIKYYKIGHVKAPGFDLITQGLATSYQLLYKTTNNAEDLIKAFDYSVIDYSKRGDGFILAEILSIYKELHEIDPDNSTYRKKKIISLMIKHVRISKTFFSAIGRIIFHKHNPVK